MKLEDEDGIDGGFDRAMSKAMTEDRLSQMASWVTSAQVPSIGKENFAEALLEIKRLKRDNAILRRDLEQCQRALSMENSHAHEAEVWQLRFHCPRHGNKDWDAPCRCDLKDRREQ